MATVVIMPKQGQSVESCILTRIIKKKGDTVAIGDILFTYETDKASFEEEAKAAGTVLEIFYEEGDDIPVLMNVMVIGNPGESVEEYRQNGETVAMEISPPLSKEALNPPPPPISPASPVSPVSPASPVSPRARTLAEKNAISASQLSGTGPQGRVVERDVQAFIDNTSDSHIVPLTIIRKRIAKAMHESLQNSAQLTHHLGADARRILSLREKLKEAVANDYPAAITLNDMICRATILALQKFPQANAHFLGDSIRIYSKVHLGIAVDTERGLMVPTVKNADELTIQALADRLKEVVNACKKGAINPDLLSSEAASFSISNLGNYGVEMFTPILNLPQVAILGVNTIVLRPKELEDGGYEFVPYLGLSLTYDHRALDGAEATRFLKQIAVEIENLECDV